MGLFSFDKKNKSADTLEPEKSAVSNPGGIKPTIGSSLPQTNTQQDLQTKLKLQKLEKQYQLQTKELHEHEEYLRNVMDDLNLAVKQKRFADKELNEHEEYLRQLMEGYQKLSKSYQWAENEIKEHEEYTRKLLETLSKNEKQSSFKDKELKEHEDYLRDLMEGYQKLSKSYKWQENEIKEHEEYTRKLLETITTLQRQSALKDQEIAEHEEYTRNLLESYQKKDKESKLKDKEIAEHEQYMRNIMESFNSNKKQVEELTKRLKFAETEIKEHEEYTRNIASQISNYKSIADTADEKISALKQQLEVERKKVAFRESEVHEQENYLRNVLENYTKILRKTRNLNSEINEVDSATRSLVSQLGDKIKSSDFIENEIKEQEQFIRHLAQSYANSERDKKELNHYVGQLEVALKSHQAVQVLDANGNILSVNEYWTKINGFTQAEVSGMPDFMYYHFADSFERNRVELALNAVKMGKVQNIAVSKVQKNGQPVRVNCAFIPKLNAQNQVTEIIKIENIALEPNQQNFNLFETLMQVAGEQILITQLSPTLQIENITTNFCSLLGYTKEELIGKPIDDLFSEEFEIQFSENNLIHLIERGRTVKRNFEFVNRNSGAIIPVKGKVSAIHLPGGSKLILFSGKTNEFHAEPQRFTKNTNFFTAEPTASNFNSGYQKVTATAQGICSIVLDETQQIVSTSAEVKSLFGSTMYGIEGRLLSDYLVKNQSNKYNYQQLFGYTANYEQPAKHAVFSFLLPSGNIKFFSVSVHHKGDNRSVLILTDVSAFYFDALEKINKKRQEIGAEKLNLFAVGSVEIEEALLHEGFI